jgi:hypothetical protein
MSRQRDQDFDGEPGEYEEEDDHPVLKPQPGKTLRVIDWMRALKLGLFYFPIAAVWSGIIAVFVATGITHNQDRSVAIAFAVFGIVLLLGLLAIVVHLIGVLLDPERDRLTYPTYFWRRSVPISEIRNANCETLIGHNPIGQGIFGLLIQTGSYGTSSGPKRKSRLPRVYVVDVSGDDFGRQIRFGARYKRNKFLSNLQAVAPGCKITRGSWY